MIFDDAHTRTLLAVLHQDHPTVRSVAAETGCSASCAHGRLRRLRLAGLVTWDRRKQGTLRATCTEHLPIERIMP